MERNYFPLSIETQQYLELSQYEIHDVIVELVERMDRYQEMYGMVGIGFSALGLGRRVFRHQTTSQKLRLGVCINTIRKLCSPMVSIIAFVRG